MWRDDAEQDTLQVSCDGKWTVQIARRKEHGAKNLEGDRADSVGEY